MPDFLRIALLFTLATNSYAQLNQTGHDRFPLPRPRLPDRPPTCNNSYTPNEFPDVWYVNNVAQPTSYLFAAMQFQLCSGLCGPLEGFTEGEFVVEPQKPNGCAAAIKISSTMEAYMFATHFGLNCDEAMTRMTTKCGQIPWATFAVQNTDDVDELYLLGIRTLNTPNNVSGDNHAPLNPDPAHHVPYTQMACRSTTLDRIIWDVALRNYGDISAFKQSILTSCNIKERIWDFRPDTSFTFKDGTLSDAIFTFETDLLNGQEYQCVVGEIAVQSGINGVPSFRCGEGIWQEVDRMARIPQIQSIG